MLAGGKHTMTKKIRKLHLSVPERAAFTIGIISMQIGAAAESMAMERRAI